MEIWEQANALHLEKKYSEAERLYDLLLTQNPSNPGLLATLGTLYLQTERMGLAICLLEASLRCGPKQSDVLSNLALAYKNTGQMDKAKGLFEESIKDDPSGETLANYSAILIESGRDEEMREICLRAIEKSPNHPVAHWNYALALLAAGEWDKAWDEAEWGLGRPGLRANRELGGVPFWDGTPGKKVAIYGEQGIGDEIMFASMLPDILKTNEVVFECHTRLKTLFEKSFPGLQCYGTREDKEPQWPAECPFDYRLSIGSLGKFYRRSKESFPGTPYLKADPLPRGDKFRVGISWKGGGAKMGRVQKRSVPLPWWNPILNVPDIEFVSLQYGVGKEEDLDVMDALGYKIRRFEEVDAEDYYETARLTASCDLVISVNTSLVHLAGALGVPCWTMTPCFPAWRYQNKGGMPWYKSVRLYRAPVPEQIAWKAVIDKIGLDLANLMQKSRRVRRVA